MSYRADTIVGMKRCKKCGITKPFSEFYLAKGMRDGHRSECKECHAARQKAWYQRNQKRAIAVVRRWQLANRERHLAWRKQYNAKRTEKARADHLKRTFDITVDDYNAMLAVQDGGCAICGRRPTEKRALHVDHDHETGAVRGLLCFRCNGGMGQFAEDPERLARAIDYLTCDGFAPSGAYEMIQLARERAGSLCGVAE